MDPFFTNLDEDGRRFIERDEARPRTGSAAGRTDRVPHRECALILDGAARTAALPRGCVAMHDAKASTHHCEEPLSDR